MIISLFNNAATFEDLNDLKRIPHLFNEFRLKDNFSSQFAFIEQQSRPGDTIVLYTRKKWQTIIGMGQQNDIYQIEKNDQILFPIEDMIEYQKSRTLAFGVFALISCGGYGIYLRMKLLEKRRLQPT